MSLFNYVNGQIAQTSIELSNDIATGLEVDKVGLHKSGLSALKKLEKLPNTTSEKAIVAASVDNGKMTARVAKLTRLAKNRLNIARQITRGIQVQEQYQMGMMDLDIQLQDSSAKYGIKQGLYGLDREMVQQGYTSYINELQGESNDILSNF